MDNVQQIIARLDYNFTQFTLDDFIRAIATHRNRPICPRPWTFTNNMLTGVWIPAPKRDYILFSRDSPPVYKIHIILHEVAHMLLNHPIYFIAEMGSTGRFRQINNYRELNEHELEAEEFVGYIHTAVYQAKRLQQLTQTTTSIQSLQHFTEAVVAED